jgi:hypothetical protein
LYNSVDAYDTAADTWTAKVPDPIGCVEDDGASARGRAGLTLHLANDGTGDQLYAVGGSIGISLPTRCNESTSLTPSTDTVPPVFSGLATATEVFCTVPEVVLAWPQGTDSQTPPVAYNVYRGISPTFTPDATSRIASRVTGLTYKDTLTANDCFQSFWYVVRAEDSAAPPNEETNTARVPVDLQCQTPSPPADIGNRLFIVKDPSRAPSLDWSRYTPAAAVTHYHVHRTVSTSGFPGNTVAEPAVRTWTDTSATGTTYFYDVRSVIDCMGLESQN